MTELAHTTPATFDLDSRHVNLDGAYTQIAAGMEQLSQTEGMREQVALLAGMIEGVNGAY
jgi:hypothetical protein